MRKLSAVRCAECRCDQLTIHVLGHFNQLAAGKAKNKAIAVVVASACFGDVVAARFDYDMIAIAENALRDHLDPAFDALAQHRKQLGQHGLLAVITARPAPIPRDDPAEIIRHRVDERARVALCGLRKDLLQQLLVLSRAHQRLPAHPLRISSPPRFPARRRAAAMEPYIALSRLGTDLLTRLAITVLL